MTEWASPRTRRQTRSPSALMGMLERAADVGGEVEINSPSGRGTKVALTIPLAV